MTGEWRLGTMLWIGLAVLAWACAPSEEPVTEDTRPTADGRGDAPPAAVAPATSINAVMVGLVDHAAHHIWDLGREGMAPGTDQEWDEVAHHSIQLIASGTMITAGGTGALDANWVRQATWQEWARQVTEAGRAAWEAANRRDLDAVLGAGDDLIEACEGCHQEYKPALPTEGIVHPHY